MSVPRVSIGLPTYNGATYLQATLDSLLAQDLADIELIISDNGSTDDTEAICRAAVASDDRVRYQRSPVNRGAGWNYNEVLRLARAPLFKWAADDDICEPSFLRRCVDALDADPGLVLAYPRTLLIDEHGEVTGPLDDSDLALAAPDPVARLDQLLSHRVEWHPVFGVIRTDALRRTRGIGSFVLADVAVLAELAVVGRFHQVPDDLFLRRYHDQRSAIANPEFNAHLAWYDPALRDQKVVLPNARLVRELLRRVVEAPLSATERTRAGAVVLRRWGLPHWRHIGGEVKLVLKRRAAMSRAARTAPRVVTGGAATVHHAPNPDDSDHGRHQPERERTA